LCMYGWCPDALIIMQCICFISLCIKNHTCARYCCNSLFPYY
jgi:hypothetical protein